VQAGATDLVTLDHDDRHAVLGRAQRRGVAAAAPSEDEEVDGAAGGRWLSHCCSTMSSYG
jgi:hypothetical protein